NVGKSVLFGALTGTYVTVSNYPGTTVEVARGRGRIGGEEFEVVDTPGMYTLITLTEDERVARSILLVEKPDIVMQVVDAKNLDKMLPLTLQLIEAELPVILVLNMMDEADKAGVKINVDYLENALNIPVVATVATTGWGIEVLNEKVKDFRRRGTSGSVLVKYDDPIESALSGVISVLKADYAISKRTVGLLLLQGDREISKLVQQLEGGRYSRIEKLVKEAQTHYVQPLNYVLTLQRYDKVVSIASNALTSPSKIKATRAEHLSRLTMNPWIGVPILAMVLYFGFYQFVGLFGAGVLVGLLEEDLFEGFINPHFTEWVLANVPYTAIQDLLVGKYGVFTLGVRYAVALILPIVGTFFIIFSLIEDVGYLPRLAMLIDKVFKKIGLTGRAVIPMVLGFGCDTMGTIVTRTQETRRERVIATMLLALAIPCSAQLGVILAILSTHPAALGIWAGAVFAVFILVGYLASKLMPGPKPSFSMEIPPLRMPKLGNILAKTLARMEWYFVEVFPYFILASVLIWVGQMTGVFQLTVKALEPLVGAIGLPGEVAVVFLFGFFRRDYGAAGLYDLQQAGLLSGVQLAVTAVTLTLFVPCIAQFMIMAKERGVKVALPIVAFIFPFALAVGYVLNIALTTLGVQI
ncbi:MAG: ferrous iron transport protein B, partial [Candidatus Bathyarchaeia archaeon]